MLYIVALFFCLIAALPGQAFADASCARDLVPAAAAPPTMPLEQAEFLVSAPTMPAQWPLETQQAFRSVFSLVQQQNAPDRADNRGQGLNLSIEEIQIAVAAQYGQDAKRISPIVGWEDGGKVTLTYLGNLGKRILVKMNATRGQFYYTVIERVNGKDTYMMLSRIGTGAWGGLRPCYDMALCHYGVQF